jgi:hypothetical protein
MQAYAQMLTSIFPWRLLSTQNGSRNLYLHANKTNMVQGFPVR